MPQEAIVCYQRAVQTRPNAIAFGECSFIIYRYKFMSYVAACFNSFDDLSLCPCQVLSCWQYVLLVFLMMSGW